MNIVVNSFPFNPGKLYELTKDFPDINFSYTSSIEEFEKEIKSADAVFTIKLKSLHLASAKNLKWIQGLMAGVDGLPIENIRNRDIILTTGRGIHKDHMIEYALSMMIIDSRNLNEFILNKKEKKWDPNFRQNQIKGKTLGILGLGSIGKELAKKASFMGMDVIGLKRTKSHVPYVKKVYTEENMDEVFSLSDYIVNLLPLTEKTEKIVNANLFKKMKPTACMMNIGRGGTVNEDDLLQALKNKVFRNYISDVFEEEPLPSSNPLWNLDNIIITPHICGSNINYMSKAYNIVKKNIEKYRNDKEKMINKYSYKRGY